MNGDFARITFDPQQQFTRVLLQQGRVLLEADFNEQSAIHHHFLRAFIIDVVGRRWRPASGGFIVEKNPNGSADFLISAGHFYVDGILCVNDGSCAYSEQPGPEVPDDLDVPEADGCIAFLDCWERHVSAIQRPDLREVALGGPDTATRAQVTWRVRLASRPWAETQLGVVATALRARNANDEADKVEKALTAFGTMLDDFKDGVDVNTTAGDAVLAALDAARPRMRARAQHNAVNDDPCTITADAQYRGRENQLYRIEIHNGGNGGQASFKWSRENASVMFAIAMRSQKSGNASEVVVKVSSLGHDRRTGLCEGDWVELTGDFFEYGMRSGLFAQVLSIDQLRLAVTIRLVAGQPQIDLSLCTVMKRWDQKADVNKSGLIPVRESGVDGGGWLPLERGVEVQFLPGAVYEPGDYWLIPARAALHNIDWPQTGAKPAAIAPHGTIHHRATIGVAKKVGAGWVVTASS